VTLIALDQHAKNSAWLLFLQPAPAAAVVVFVTTVSSQLHLLQCLANAPQARCHRYCQWLANAASGWPTLLLLLLLLLLLQLLLLSPSSQLLLLLLLSAPAHVCCERLYPVKHRCYCFRRPQCANFCGEQRCLELCAAAAAAVAVEAAAASKAVTSAAKAIRHITTAKWVPALQRKLLGARGVHCTLIPILQSYFYNVLQLPLLLEWDSACTAVDEHLFCWYCGLRVTCSA
jgi:hypothetical protein